MLLLAAGAAGAAATALTGAGAGLVGAGLLIPRIWSILALASASVKTPWSRSLIIESIFSCCSDLTTGLAAFFSSLL